MQLPGELRLLKASIVSTHHYGTDDGIKSVIVIEAPIGMTVAKILGLEFLFTKNGAPLSIVKSFQLEGKFETVKVEFPMGDNDLKSIIPEQVGSLRVKHVNDVGLVLAARIHVLNEPIEVVAIHDRKRKAEFVLVMRPAQMKMFNPEDAQETADVDAEPAAAAEKFTGKKLSAEIMIRDCEGGFQPGWTAQLKGRHKQEVSEPIGLNSPVFESESQAREHAAAELISFVKAARAVPRSEAETAELDQLMAWLESKNAWRAQAVGEGVN